jgi:adenylate kinase family enzyme
MHHIINIRGTSGSGKSTLVRRLMEAHGPVTPLGSPKVQGYQCGPGLRVVGRYTTACGGCDGIKTQDEICARVREYAQHGHVVFEGLLASGLHSRYRDLAREMGGFTFAFLNTPLDVCLARVVRRRFAKGNFEPLDPSQTVAKHKVVQRVARYLEHDGFPVVWLPWPDPLPVLEAVLSSPLGTVRGCPPQVDVEPAAEVGEEAMAGSI